MSFVSSLLAVPALILFQVVWLISSLRRPVLLVAALCILSDPRAAFRKLRLSYVSALYLLFCKDKKWKVPIEDPASCFPEELGGTMSAAPAVSPAVCLKNVRYKEKTLVLVRHGESTWNDTFNAGDRSKAVFVLLFVPNLIYAIALETYYFVSGKDSMSWFFDSPLSKKGAKQAEGLRKFLRKEKMRLGSSPGKTTEEKAIKLILALGEDDREGGPSSVVVSSNLRRAISTAAIGLADRFASTAVQNKSKSGAESKSGDGILLLPSLQEISRNPDALSILPPGGAARPTWCDDEIDGLPRGTFASLVDSRHHAGNKSLDSNGLLRLGQFCADVFDRSKVSRDVVVAVGHSLFFRSVFQVYLPRGFTHVSKKKKLVNAGTVVVTLREATMGDGRKVYMIDPNSVAVVYGGFAK